MPYKKVTDKIITELENIVGSQNVVTDQEKLEVYGGDEVPESEWKHLPEVVVKPSNAGEVSEVIKLANRELIPITPRGAGTGLAAGAVPMLGGIVLTVENMNRILEIDKQNLFMVLEPGVTTGEVQKHAWEEGFFYAGDPCRAERAFIGGNVATNAGGNKAVKYGTTSRYVYGLEVVLPTGEITTLGGKCVKDVTGYDLVHLMVGSEGTLGVITKIYLKLMPLPSYNAVLLVPFTDMRTAINIVPLIMTNGGIIPTSIEFMDNTCIRSAEEYLNRKLPFGDAGAYIIIEVEAYTESQLESDYETIGNICLENGGLEVFVGDNKSSQEKIWKARRYLAESLRVTSPVYCMEDIVVPVSGIPAVVEDIDGIAGKYNIKIANFGHAGDGNIHATLLKENMPDDTWYEVKQKVLEEIYASTHAHGGKLSGEHGIGAKRVKAMARYLDPAQMRVIAAIKKALDPNLVLNPDKLINVE